MRFCLHYNSSCPYCSIFLRLEKCKDVVFHLISVLVSLISLGGDCPILCFYRSQNQVITLKICLDRHVSAKCSLSSLPHICYLQLVLFRAKRKISSIQIIIILMPDFFEARMIEYTSIYLLRNTDFHPTMLLLSKVCSTALQW